MGIKDKLKSAAHIARGRVKEHAGNMTSDRSLASEGRAERAKGDLKQAAEKTKDALK
jgi:uncharacterized protein YjbJ (UPF0337 family)